MNKNLTFLYIWIEHQLELTDLKPQPGSYLFRKPSDQNWLVGIFYH